MNTFPISFHSFHANSRQTLKSALRVGGVPGPAENPKLGFIYLWAWGNDPKLA